MSNSIFWRLLWKEYRTQRAFWISMVVLAALLQLLVLASAYPHDDVATRLFAFALGLPAFYALGCGATLFATEHETGTYEFLRTLPVSAPRLFFARAAFAVVSTLLMIALLWPLAALMAGWQLPRASEHLVVWGLFGFALVELLVWGMFFSLLIKRPLMAAILGVTAASLSVHFITWVLLGFGGQRDLEPYFYALPYRVVLAAVVAMVDVWLGFRWFDEATVRWRAAGPTDRREAAAKGISHPALDVPASREIALRRLIWHHWRQSTRMAAIVGLLLAPLVVATLWHLGTLTLGGRIRSAHGLTEMAVLLATAAAPLLGSCVFLADQQGRSFRFFADRGVRPRYLWLSRHLVWLTVLLAGGIVALFAGIAFNHPIRDMPNIDSLITALALVSGYVVLAYLCGQLCSMFFRSGLLAGFFGLVLTGVLCSWAVLMWSLGMSWLWSVAPLLAAMLLATWLRAPDWLLERNSLRAWLRPGLVLAVPTLAILTAVPLVRVYEIPAVDPGFSPEAYARPITPEEEKTLEMYRRAAAAYVLTKDESKDEEESEDGQQPMGGKGAGLTAKEVARLEANREAIALTLEATQREACDFFDPTVGDGPTWDLVQECRLLGWLLVDSARQLESEGKLDAARDRYLAALRLSLHLRHRTMPWVADAIETSVYKRLPFWAAHADQTPERIRGVINQLDNVDAQRPSLSHEIKLYYLLNRRSISADPEALASLYGEQRNVFLITLWARLLPWEKARALRILNLSTNSALKSLRAAEDSAACGARIGLPAEVLRQAPYRAYSPRESAAWGLLECVVHPEWSVERLLRLETRRRAARLQLALEAWKAEHGQLPESLNELVGPYLDRLPVEPRFGQPFQFFREGLPIPLSMGDLSEAFQPGTPFVAVEDEGTIRHDTSLPMSDDTVYVSPIRIDRIESDRQKTEYFRWRSGRLFPVP